MFNTCSILPLYENPIILRRTKKTCKQMTILPSKKKMTFVPLTWFFFPINRSIRPSTSF